MKTAGYIDMLPYSKDGFVINGFKDKNGILHMSNMRIYKQRSMTMFDLIDINTNIIYQKVFITTTVGNTQEILDYSNTDINLAQQINKNSFFIRNFDKSKRYYGFIIRILSNKVTIDSSFGISNYIYNYDLVIKDEPKIFSLSYVTPHLSDTSFNVIVNGQFIDPTTITSKITMSDGTVYDGHVNGYQISFNGIVFVGTEFDILVEAEGAIDYAESIEIIGDNIIYDNITDFIVSSDMWIPTQNNMVAYTILPTEHNRGNIFAIQTYDDDTDDLEFVQATLDLTGGLTLHRSAPANTKVVIAGDSFDHNVSVVDIDTLGWVQTSDGYQYSILASEIPSDFGIFNIWIREGQTYSLSFSDLNIDFNNNIILNSNVPYSGKLVLL